MKQIHTFKVSGETRKRIPVTMPTPLVQRMNTLAQKLGRSRNSIFVQCMECAMKNMNEVLVLMESKEKK